MSNPYQHYPDVLGMTALSANGGPTFEEVSYMPAVQMALMSAGPGYVNVYESNPSMALYSSGNKGMFTASPYADQCDDKCIGSCPDPRLRSVKPLYVPFVPQGPHPTIYQSNGMY